MHCDWPEWTPNPNPMPNNTLILTLTLTNSTLANPTLTLKITAIYAVQLPNVFRKLIVTFHPVPWIILLAMSRRYEPDG